MTNECISLIFELRTIFLSFQMALSFARAAVVWADLATIAPQFHIADPDIRSDATGVVRHQFGLFCTDLHAIGCRGAVKAFD